MINVTQSAKRAAVNRDVPMVTKGIQTQEDSRSETASIVEVPHGSEVLNLSCKVSDHCLSLKKIQTCIQFIYSQ